jgi:hypothetical protein
MSASEPHSTRSVPVLTEVVQVNESLRPAILPWQIKNRVQEVMGSGYIDQDALADKVIEKVNGRIAELLPDLLRDSVDQVLREHALEHQKKNI